MFFSLPAQPCCALPFSLIQSCPWSGCPPSPSDPPARFSPLLPTPTPQPRAPTPPSPDEFPTDIKQAYKAFAAVPHSLAVQPPQQVGKMAAPIRRPVHVAGCMKVCSLPYWAALISLLSSYPMQCIWSQELDDLTCSAWNELRDFNFPKMKPAVKVD